MAPNLGSSKIEAADMMITAGDLTAVQMAKVVDCHERTIRRLRTNKRLFGSVKAPLGKGGRPRSLNPVMVKTLCDHLLGKPNLYLYEMAEFIWDVFEKEVTTSSIRRALLYEGWSKKKAKQRASEQNADLREEYFDRILHFHSDQFVFVDESGCDKRIGIRRTGWSPRGITPVQVTKFHRGQRYHILPAYAQDGIILSRIFQGSTDASVFEDFIEELLHHCGRYPAPKSILVMDNASFHRSQRIKEMCLQKGVQLIFLPPYSPDLNPIEEFFAELKAFIRQNWQSYEDNPSQGFGFFLQWCVDVVGAKKQSAEGHFQNAGLTIEEA